MSEINSEEKGLTRKLLKDSSILFFAEGFSGAFLLGQMLLMARYMGAERFGTYAVILAFAQTINYLINIRTWDLLFHYFAAFRAQGKKDDAIATIKLSYCATIATAVFAIPASWLLAVIFEQILGIDYLSDYIILASLYLALRATEVFAHAFFRQFDKFLHFSVIVVTRTILDFGFVILLLVLNSNTDYSVIFIARSAAVGIGMIAFIYFGIRIMNQHFGTVWLKVPLKRLRAKTIEMLLFTAHSHATSVWSVAYWSLDILILGSLLGEAAVGIYRIAKTFSQLSLKLIDPIYNSVFPQLTKLWHSMTRSKFSHYLYKVSLLMAGIFIPTFIILQLIGTWLIPSIAGAAMGASITPAMILLWSQLPAAVFVWQKPLIIAIGKPGVYHSTTALAAIVSLLSIFIFVPAMEVEGAAWAVALFPIILVIANSAYILFTGTLKKNENMQPQV